MRVSIVTICYNDLENLKSTLESVQSQSFHDFEHIIVDGASTDGTPAFLATLDPVRHRYISEKDQGLYNAMNKGLGMCRGDYVFFLNAGDKFFLDTSLKDAAKFLNGEDLVYFDIWLKFADRYILRRYPDEISQRFWLTNHLCHQACFISRRSFEKVGLYDETFKIASDHDHFLRIFKNKELTWKHADWSAVVYDMSGVSAKPETHAQTLAEIAQAQRAHLPRLPRFIYGRRVMFGQWIEARQGRWSRFFLRTFVSPLGKVVAAEDTAIDHEYDELPSLHPSLRILIVNAQECRGGAAVAASRLHAGLRKMGILSTMLVLEKNSNSKQVVKATTKNGPAKLVEIFLSKVDFFLKKLCKNRLEGSLMSPGLVAWVDIAKRVEYLRPDVVHLNWICEGFTRIENLPKIKRPVVWTMHDMWAFCGAEHVTFSNRFKEGYFASNRPSHEAGLDLNRWNWLRKKNVYSQFSRFLFVGPSRWMKECIDQSDLLKGKKSFVVQNGLDTEIFFPREKAKVREFLNIPQNKKVIIFGAVDASKDPNKGFQFLVEALYRIDESKAGEDIFVMVFGYVDESLLPKFSFPIRTMGYISNSSILASVYSCADVMIVPSRIESFGQSASEAMACGVPVVAFNSSGLRDIVDHEVNGFLAKCYEHRDLAKGILWVLDDPERLKRLSLAARQKILDKFTAQKMASSYLQLYRQCLSQKIPTSDALEHNPMLEPAVL